MIRWGWAGPGLLGFLLVAAWSIAYFQWIPDRVPPVSSASFLALGLPTVFAMRAICLRRDGDVGVVHSLPGVSALLLALALICSPLGGEDFLTNGAPRLYTHLAEELSEEDQVVVAWEYAPSLAFYTQRIYRPFQYQGELDYGMNHAPELPREIETTEELLALAREGPGRLFMVVHPEEAERFAKLPVEAKPLNLSPTSAGRVMEILGPH